MEFSSGESVLRHHFWPTLTTLSSTGPLFTLILDQNLLQIFQWKRMSNPNYKVSGSGDDGMRL